MRKLVIIAGCALASCSNSSSSQQPVPSAPIIAGVGDGYISKICDEGRAVYVYDGYKSGGIAIVEDAPECSA